MGAATYTKAWLFVVGAAVFKSVVGFAALAVGSVKAVDATVTDWFEAVPDLAWSGSMSAGYAW